MRRRRAQKSSSGRTSLDFKTLFIGPGAAFAPMAGLSDASARRLMASYGAAYTVSEMVSAKALC